MILQNHKCGLCKLTYKTEKQYLEHECSANRELTPLDPRYYGEDFSKISELALARGAARKKTQDQNAQIQQ